ncbi:hypothetical protein BDSB_09065 [Burkholderia dolosa PC543]|nr:hypothetical protein BDSB_09065 [Burkholderia dolosa PC543]
MRTDEARLPRGGHRDVRRGRVRERDRARAGMRSREHQ